MSYFITSAGAQILKYDLDTAALVPAQDAQDYIRALIPELSSLDGTPLFLVDDGETGTSSALVIAATKALGMGEPIENTSLYAVMTRLALARHTVRIWWAGESESAHLDVEHCSGLRDAVHLLLDQASTTIRLRATFNATA